MIFYLNEPPDVLYRPFKIILTHILKVQILQYKTDITFLRSLYNKIEMIYFRMESNKYLMLQTLQRNF